MSPEDMSFGQDDPEQEGHLEQANVKQCSVGQWEDSQQHRGREGRRMNLKANILTAK